MSFSKGWISSLRLKMTVTYDAGWWFFGSLEVKMYGGKVYSPRPLWKRARVRGFGAARQLSS